MGEQRSWICDFFQTGIQSFSQDYLVANHEDILYTESAHGVEQRFSVFVGFLLRTYPAHSIFFFAGAY